MYLIFKEQSCFLHLLYSPLFILQKDHLTYEEALNIQKTQAELLSKVSEFEQITRHVARMIKMKEVPSSQLDMTMPLSHYLKPSIEPMKVCLNFIWP